MSLSGRRDEEPPSIIETEADDDAEVESFTLGAEAPGLACPRVYPSVHISNAGGGSDAGSHCSSVESLLESRKPDPEEILLELGFGGSDEPDAVSRIPTRFLRPSSLKGIAIDDFVKHQKLLVHTFQSGFSGYRGLTGPSHAMPSVIVGKIMERLREAEVVKYADEDLLLDSKKTTLSFAKVANNVLTKVKSKNEAGTSVLSADNRRWYESQGDKSPEPTNKRIIIGHQSYTFSKDGSLIESPQNSLNRNDCSSSEISHTESALGVGDIINDSIITEVVEEEVILENKQLPLLDQHLAIEKEVEQLQQKEHEKEGIRVSSSSGGGDNEEMMEEEEDENEMEEDERSVKFWNTEEDGNDGHLVVRSTSVSEEASVTSAIDQDMTEDYLAQEYKNMAMLVDQLSGTEVCFDIGTEENFCKLSPEERKGLVVSLIESALTTYQKRLRELDLRSQLKDLLSGQLHKVTDLLDEAQTPSLATLIKQMTSLLRHQESLRKELQMHEAQTSVGYKDTIS